MKKILGALLATGTLIALPSVNHANYSTIYNPSKLPAGQQRSFPTAEGFGAASLGGRGGRVIQVTTLADSGTGSLRACMMDTGPRTCVFRVSGTIELLSQIKPTSGYLTVAGQTAPGDGIAIKNHPNNLTGSPLFFNAPHNIIRHIRVRPGPTNGIKQDTTDGITVDSRAPYTILDHVSLSWATDEPFNTTKAASNITIQWSMVYEGLSKSTHKSGEHSKGMFLEGNNITAHHVFMAHATDRMPNAGVGTRADFVNLISYNMREKAHQYFSMKQKEAQSLSGLKRQANIVGNWVSMGPSSLRGTAIFGGNYDEQYSTNPGNAEFYLYQNIDGRRRSHNVDNRMFMDPLDWKYVKTQPIGDLSVQLFSSPEQAVKDVAAFAGAFPRDASDRRVLQTFFGCSGRIINSPSEVGGWPVLQSSAAYIDNDRDGMDDNWEIQNKVSSATADADGDGYTNLEEFLNELAGDQDSYGNMINRVGMGNGNVPAPNCGIAI